MRVRRKTAIFVCRRGSPRGDSGAGFVRSFKPRPMVLQGAVIKRDADPNKEQPIADVEVTVASGLASLRGQVGRDGLLSGHASEGNSGRRDSNADVSAFRLRAAATQRSLPGIAFTLPAWFSLAAGSPRGSSSSRNARRQSLGKICRQDHYGSRGRQRSQGLSGDQRRQRALRSKISVLAGWKMEGGNRFRDRSMPAKETNSAT